MGAGHVGGGPGFVDEDQPLGIEVRLALEPLPAPLQDVGAVLFHRVGELFLRVIRWRRKKRRSVP
jgi:hypothetical protein